MTKQLTWLDVLNNNLKGKTIAAIKLEEDVYGEYIQLEFTDGTDAQIYSASDSADHPKIYA